MGALLRSKLVSGQKFWAALSPVPYCCSRVLMHPWLTLTSMMPTCPRMREGRWRMREGKRCFAHSGRRPRRELPLLTRRLRHPLRPRTLPRAQACRQSRIILQKSRDLLPRHPLLHLLLLYQGWICHLSRCHHSRH